MRFCSTLSLITSLLLSNVDASLNSQIPFFHDAGGSATAISAPLFAELEELARIVDISYCVGTSGIQKPFQCASRCKDFPHFELVKTWSTGVMMSDSCGYIALDHNPAAPRLILAFRGTYSLANTIVDLSTVPQDYVPYPGDKTTPPSGDSGSDSKPSACTDCKVHSGFLTSWENTRKAIFDDFSKAALDHPSYRLHLVGHSLGAAVALLAALDLKARSYEPHVTTFGEPRVGNGAFVAHVDARLASSGADSAAGKADEEVYRRVTHVDDPVPLLPLTEWGYQPHAGELYIAKASLPPDVSDIRRCEGDRDEECSAGGDSTLAESSLADDEPDLDSVLDVNRAWDIVKDARNTWSPIPTRLKLWQLFFAHRDYFWRLGLCVRGGDPWDWKGEYPVGDAEHDDNL